MKKKQKSKIIKYLIISLLFVILFFGSYYLFKPRDKENNLYVYTGVNGENYTFTKFKEGTVDIHQLTFYGLLKGVEKQYTIRLRYGPNEVKDIPYQSVRNFVLDKRLIYLTQDLELPNLTKQASVLAIFEINSVLGTEDYNVFQIPRESTVTSAVSGSSNLQVKDCKDETKFIGVIKLKLSNTTRIYFEDNGCVVLEAKNKEDIIRVADKLIYHLLELF